MNRLFLGVVCLLVAVTGCGQGYAKEDLPSVGSSEAAIMYGDPGGDPDFDGKLMLSTVSAFGGPISANAMPISVKVTMTGNTGVQCAGAINAFHDGMFLGGKQVTFTGTSMSETIYAQVLPSGGTAIEPNEVHAVVWLTPVCAPKLVTAPVVKTILRLK